MAEFEYAKSLDPMDNLLDLAGQLVARAHFLRNAYENYACIAEGLLLRAGHVLDDDVSW